MTSPNADRPDLIAVIAAFFGAHPGPGADQITLGPCERIQAVASEPEPQAEI